MSEPWLFVVGCPRSGTTALREALSAHAELHVAHELRVLELAQLAAQGVDGDRVTARGVLAGRAWAREVAGAPTSTSWKIRSPSWPASSSPWAGTSTRARARRPRGCTGRTRGGAAP